MRINLLCFKIALFGILLSSSFAFAQTQEAREKITGTYNKSKLNTLRDKFEQKAKSNKERALAMAKVKGWEVTRVTEKGEYQELMSVTSDGHPIYYTTFNVAAANSTRANHLNSGGSLGLNLNGQNMTAHVWDGGLARSTHQEYDGPGGSDRFSIGDGTTGLHYHSAHVTGTIIASGVSANAKGMATHARAIGYEWNSDLAEATAAAANGMLLSNHSYGNRGDLIPDWYFGAYHEESRDWDELLFNSPYYLMVVAAGNDGQNNSYNGQPLNGSSSYDKLSGHATSKNNLVVANAQDASINASGNLISVSINSGSSQGPTDDLRIKPDIAGNGTSVYSTYETSNTAYGTISGTSMASPNVTGTLLLLQQHYNNVNGSFMRAASLKGLALHTADDAGTTGPDVIFGYGLLNAKKAAETISQNGTQSRINELVLTSGQTYTTTVQSDGVNKLIASICWTDPAGTANTGTANLTTPVLVNNLDIRVSKSGTTYNPFRLTSITTNSTGDNNVDPYERVDVASATGTYTITVTHKGTLQGGSQNFSLIVTGITSGTPPVCNATVPTGLAASGITSSSATLNWAAVSNATYDVQYRVVGSSTWTTAAAATNSTSLSGLTASTQYEVQVRSKCTSTTSAYSASVNFTTGPIQLVYCTSNGNNVSDEFIGRVQVGTINNASSANGGYGNFTALSTNLTKSTSYTITVTPTWTSTSYPEGYAAWIDYNIDGDFADAGEQVWTRTATSTTPVTGSFTVPATAATGSTRMRVSMRWNAIPASCGSFDYGEVEDYTVNIAGGTIDNVPPTAPTNLAASGITQTSANLSWTASTDVFGVTGYEVRVNGVLNGSPTGTTYALSGLTAGTTYSVSVTARDAAGNVSAASSINVTTLSPCNNVTLSLTLDNYPDETSWNIKNSSGTIVASGGPYSRPAQNGLTITSTSCLPAGCYTFTINDSYGDGICCSYGNGSYTLRNDASTILASGASFTSTMTHNFCVGGATMNQSMSEEVSVSRQGDELTESYVYPNPVNEKGRLKISVPNSVKIIATQVRSSNGVTVGGSQPYDENGLDVSNLQAGVYILNVWTDKGVIIRKFIKQ